MVTSKNTDHYITTTNNTNEKVRNIVRITSVTGDRHMTWENTGEMVLNRLAPHRAATNLLLLTNTASVKRNKAKCCMYSTCVRAESLQSGPTLSDPMDCSPLGSSVHDILQASYWSGLPCPPPGCIAWHPPKNTPVITCTKENWWAVTPDHLKANEGWAFPSIQLLVYTALS